MKIKTMNSHASRLKMINYALKETRCEKLNQKNKKDHAFDFQ